MNPSKGKGTGGRSSSPHSTMDYVLHDKDERTSNRVGKIDLMNLATKDPKRVAREMQTTIDATAAMKKREGIPQTGQKTEKPVYHFSLSWHPDDKPDVAHMIETARDAVKMLGLDQHQVAIVEHTDRLHKHVHIVACLIHPETGRTADLHRDNYKLDAWAHRYEASRNTIRSFQRAAKYEVSMDHRKDASRDAFNAVKDKAGKLKESIEERRKGLSGKHQAAVNDRSIERERLFKEYKVARTEIYETAQAQINEVKRQKPRTPAFELAPPGMWRRHEWMRLAHAMLQSGMAERRWPIKQAFERAKAKISPALPRKPDLSRKFDHRVEGKDIMLPMRNDPSSRMFAARHARNRKQPIQQIISQANEAKAKLAKDYETKKAEMKKNHEKQRGQEKSERNHLRTEANRSWADFRQEHGMPIKQNEWQKQRDQNKAVFNEAAKEPAKPEVPKEPRIEAKVLDKAPDLTRANDNANPNAKPREVETTMTADLWQHGQVGDHTYSAKVSAERSVHGIYAGHVSQLEIRNAQGERVANYDHGWDKRPHPLSQEFIVTQKVVDFYADHAKELPVAKPQKDIEHDNPEPTPQPKRPDAEIVHDTPSQAPAPEPSPEQIREQEIAKLTATWNQAERDRGEERER